MKSMLVGVLLSLAVACGGGQRPLPGATKPDDAILLLQCEVGEATVWVDGREIRQVRDLAGGMALSPGPHRIEVRHDDFHEVYLELTLRARERKELVVELAPVLP